MKDLFSVLMLSLGAGLFVAGSIGLLRFPDPTSRLHALTKADVLGLGAIVLGLLLQADTAVVGLKLLLIWALALLASATNCYLIARWIGCQGTADDGA
ncbi:MAG: hypothetical protein A2428_01905 [Bdellovibrionales bacterium RIFOXYC1_FULL_54_43]|nr:MAG: hypothetical protein A2428_01905 [Bdellovibrionales bacterium RIFOXYC1_FULL_54_43]OFZ81693.1 MAG: hypothetical protein A2603_12115 [Bdellovibrionales bacterium RIFOXYD1_FULL_55_31]